MRGGGGEEASRLINAGQIQPDGTDKNGNTVLMMAVTILSPELVMLLVEMGANVNSRNKKGVTALMFAALIPDIDDKAVDATIETAGYLLDHGADPNAVSHDGRTALIRAVQFYGEKRMVQLLLDHKADFRVKDKSGKSALDYARKRGDPKIIRLLENAARKR